MSEPSELVISFDEARKCPQCSHTGKIVNSRAIVGGTLHTLQCSTEVCPWYQTNWYVETDANGEVQVNEQAYKIAHGERLIAPRDPNFDAAFNAIHQNLAAQLDHETRGDAGRR